MKVLFIRGFNTDLHHGNNHYQNFETFFSFSNYALEYFNYSPDDDIEDVYTKCSQLLKSGTYKIVMAHSLGGCLLMRFCNENNDFAKKFKKLIFLMPLITNDNYLVSIASKTRIFKDNKLFKPLVVPNSNLFDLGNILNDSYNFVSCKQIATVYTKWVCNFDISLLNNDNCLLIYARDEMLNIIDQKKLDAIHNKIILTGKHEMFNDFSTGQHFFETLKYALDV